jgi:superfamily I DNA/RNA helicase
VGNYYRARLDEEGLLEPDDAYRLAREILHAKPQRLPYCAVIIDKAQDMGGEAFRLLRAVIPPDDSRADTNSLFIVGDGHQRIYGRRVVLSRCGIQVRGRSRKLRINYRTSDEIRTWALAILNGVDIDDLDNGIDDAKGYRSLFHGPSPEIVNAKSAEKELSNLFSWITRLQGEGLNQKDICVIARDSRRLGTFETALKEHGFATHLLKRRQADDRRQDGVRLATMHRAKGLEFMAVAIVGMNDGVVPNIQAIRAAADEVGTAFRISDGLPEEDTSSSFLARVAAT